MCTGLRYVAVLRVTMGRRSEADQPSKVGFADVFQLVHVLADGRALLRVPDSGRILQIEALTKRAIHTWDSRVTLVWCCLYDTAEEARNAATRHETSPLAEVDAHWPNGSFEGPGENLNI